MNMTRKMTAAIAALMMLTSLTACGGADTDPIETVVNVENLETTAPYAETAVPAESETAAETIAETQAASDAYAYLALIQSDYADSFDGRKHDACIAGDTAYFYAVAANPNDWGNLNDYKGCYSYNISTGETRCIVPYEEKTRSACYAAGKIYTIVNKELRCYDLDGTLLKSFSNTEEVEWDNDFVVEAVMNDGSCVIGEPGSKLHYLVAEDFASSKRIAEVTEGVHGMAEEDPYYFIGGCGNTIYVAESSMAKEFYGIDVTTDEKTAYTIPENAAGMGAEWVRLIGSTYYKTQDNQGTTIIDMQTGEIVAELSGLTQDYYGGEYFYKASVSDSTFSPHAQISISKYPSDGSDAESTVLFEVDSNDVQFTVLNEEYYLVTDEYGTFLRNIHSEEEVQITFE